MKSKSIEGAFPYMEESFGSVRAERIRERSYQRLEALMDENASDPKAVKAHTETDIFPGIAMYEAMEKEGIEKAEAEAFLDKTLSILAQPKAEAMRKSMKYFGLYKLMPKIFSMVAKKSYGEAAGFKAEFHNEGKGRCSFDMTECLYLKTCQRYGCPEIVKCFCHVDDVTDGSIHPKLVWARTKTMGEGGDLCDFRLYVKE